VTWRRPFSSPPKCLLQPAALTRVGLLKGDLDDSIEKVIFSLPVGKVSGWSGRRTGFIFLKFWEKARGVTSLNEAMREIETKLLSDRREAVYTEWLQGLRNPSL